MFREKQIAVELCLTSNVLCKTVPSYSDHHISRLLKINHPLAICVSATDSFRIHWNTHFHSCCPSQTDDFGVFKTSLTNELMICAQTFGMCEDDVLKLTVNANRYSFACDLERQLIADKIHRFIENRSGSLSSGGEN